MSRYRLNHDRIWLKAGRRTSRLYEAEQKAAVQPFRNRTILIKKTGSQTDETTKKASSLYRISVERYRGHIITSRRYGLT